MKTQIPQPAITPEMHDGPVRILIDYYVDPADYNAFVHAIHDLGEIRLRDGAMRWGVFQDINDPARITETFVMESWIDYLRQRERFTASDRAIREYVFGFHRGDKPVGVTYGLYAKERTNGSTRNSETT